MMEGAEPWRATEVVKAVDNSLRLAYLAGINAKNNSWSVGMASEPEVNDQNQMLLAALSAPMPRIYANGFMLGQSLSDVALVAQINGAPIAILNMSFTTAKTLASDLSKVISVFEEKTGHQIMTMHDIQDRGAGPGTGER